VKSGSNAVSFRWFSVNNPFSAAIGGLIVLRMLTKREEKWKRDLELKEVDGTLGAR